MKLNMLEIPIKSYLLDESWESPLKLICGTGGVIYGNSGLAAMPPATAEAAGISKLWPTLLLLVAFASLAEGSVL